MLFLKLPVTFESNFIAIKMLICENTFIVRSLLRNKNNLFRLLERIQPLYRNFMKILLAAIAVIFLLSVSDSSAQLFDSFKKQAEKILKNPSGFSEKEAADAIKQALTNGTSKGVDILSKTDGYLKNPAVVIPLPPEAKKVEATLRDMGLGEKVDEAVVALNRAAEDAASGAKDIFIHAVEQMTVQDAIAIVKGDSIAATNYLKKTTTAALTEKFTPVIQASLEKTKATRYWETVFTSYNKIPFVQKVNPNLTEYATQKALEGLFYMISREEAEIRKNPAARVTDLLKKVFGG